MPDVILVVLRRPEMASALLAAASRLAALIGEVRIRVLALAEPDRVHGPAARELMNQTGSVPETGERQRLSALKLAFGQWSSEAGEIAKGARWVEAEGSAPARVAEIGSRVDTIVAGRPLEHDRLARHAFRAALFGTDRPVLMVPPAPATSFGRVIAVAWRDEKRAVRAVLPALRSLRAAERVHVLVGQRQRAETPAMPSILLEHGIAADLHVLPIGSGPFGQTLLEAVHRLSADLLVMGAYAHSPLRELILGGVTRYMLTHADVPILMRH